MYILPVYTHVCSHTCMYMYMHMWHVCTPTYVYSCIHVYVYECYVYNAVCIWVPVRHHHSRWRHTLDTPGNVTQALTESISSKAVFKASSKFAIPSVLSFSISASLIRCEETHNKAKCNSTPRDVWRERRQSTYIFFFIFLLDATYWELGNYR